MKFGPVLTGEAEGTILAHAVDVDRKRFKKGRLLTTGDIAALETAGIAEIIVARLNDSDVSEDVAADRLASLLEVEGLRAAEPFTGRVNLYSDVSGIFCADRQVVNVLNQITPAITLATLDDGIFVEAGRMVATVKIIPFAADLDHVEAAQNLLGRSKALGLSPSRPHKIGLIVTMLPTLKPSVMDKTAKALADRLKPTGSSIGFENRVPHRAETVSEAMENCADDCDLIIVFGASAITDIDDVIPQAIRLCGGSVTYFGMPVDPGNLLLIGEYKGKTVIGAPGCARSPAENGFDWVLQREISGLPVDGDYISGLGVGGLLMEITARPQPREG